MFNPLRSPTNRIGQCDGWFGFGIGGGSITVLCDEGSEDGGVHCLGHTVVHCFIQEFVDTDEVITDGFFFECAEVVFEDGGQLDEEGGDECNVGVATCDCTEVQVVVLFFDWMDGQIERWVIENVVDQFDDGR